MTRLPEMTKPASNDTELRQRDKTQKAKMKNYANKKRSSHHRELKVGDKVFVKKSTRFAAMPYRQQLYEVIAVKGTMITAKHGQHVITRNISHFKLYKGENVPTDHDSSDEESSTDYAEELDIPDQPAVDPPVLAAAPVRRNPRRNRQLPRRLNDYILNV